MNAVDGGRRLSTPAARDRLGPGAGTALVGRIGGKGVLFVTQWVLATGLGPAGFGLYSLGWTILKLSTFVSPLGLHHGVIRYASRHPLESRPARRIAYDSLVLSLPLGLLTGGLLYLAADWLAGSAFHAPGLAPVLRLCALAVPLAGVLRVAAAATRVTHRMHYSIATEDLGQPLVQLLLTVGLLAAGFGVVAVTAAVPVSLLAATLAAVAIVFRIYRGETADDLPPPGAAELVAFSLPAALSGALSNLGMWADRLFLGLLRTPGEVGVYQAAAQISLLFMVVTSSFNAIFAPLSARLWHLEEKTELEGLYRVATRWGLYLCLPLVAVVVCEPALVMRGVYGAAFETGFLALLILTLGQLVNVATGGAGFLLIMSGRQRAWAWISAVGLALNVGLNLLWIPRWGVHGAALATAIGVATIYLGGLVAVRLLLGLWPYDRQVVKGVAAAAVTVAAIVGLGRLQLALEPLMELGLLAIVAGAAFLLTLLSLGLGEDDRALLEVVIGRLRPRAPGGGR